MIQIRRFLPFGSLLIAFGFAFAAATASAQSLWMPRGNDHGVMIEVVKPSLDGVDEKFASLATFIATRTPPSSGISLVAEISFARSAISTVTSFTFGNLYFGMEAGGRSTPLFGELGIHLPTAAGADGDAWITGLVSDLTRREAFFNNVLSVNAALNARRVTSKGVFYRLRLSPVLTIPAEELGDPELFAVYSGQIGYEGSALRLGVGLIARTLVTEDIGSFADRSETQAEFHADFGSGAARPGFDLKIPLGDLGETVPVVVGASLGFSY